MKSEFPGKLKAVTARQPRINSLVLESLTLPSEVSGASQRVQSARAKVAGTLKAVAAAALDIHILELEYTIDDLEAKRKKLQATIDRNAAIAEKFISAAIKGPAAVKGLLVKEATDAALKLVSMAVAGIFSQAEQAELDKVNKKLDATKRELKKDKRAKLSALFEKAKADLQSDTHSLYATVDEASAKRQKTDHNFDEIATLGSNGGMNTFKQLQKHRQEMQNLWQRYSDAAAYYSVFLASPPLGLAYKAAQERIGTLKKEQAEHLKYGSKTDDDNLIMMDMNSHYTRFSEWYRGELKKYKAVSTQLGKGEHNEVVTEVLNEAKKAVND